ncbi:sulfite exporter TauE/SafE family protein [Desulforegula conservatrix]|uniref:sulfite exporter TauE/SafE family protein n=1 Tax=Desulforegula conservatrix TaxID=153026 RepID=UPI0003F5D5F6|nr:sulfite exporter TauE/SafE family protein [Desulforegula conservatrix]
MYFQTAGIDVSPWIPPLVAFVISFFTSMGGVSGAFLLLPFQMSFLGYTNPSVSSTNQLFNIVAIPSGVYRFIKEGRMVWPLTWVVIIGTLPGVLIGAIVRVAYLPNPKNFKLFAACVLFYIGIRMIRDLTQKSNGDDKNKSEQRFQELMKKHRTKSEETGVEIPSVKVLELSLSRIRYEFYGEEFNIPVWGIMSLSFIVGIIGGVYGIGGGAIIAPFFVSVFGLPVYTVAGAALMGTFITSIAGVAFYQAIAPYYPTVSVAPDWFLGILFGIGGMAGIYLGARCQKYVPAKAIKWMLGAVIVYTATKYLFDFIK